MNLGSGKRLLVVWLFLSAITMVSLWMGSLDRPLHAPLRASAAITSGAIVIALIKVRIIFREFMEVRHAPILLCRLTDAWLSLTAVILLGAYLAGMAFSAG